MRDVLNVDIKTFKTTGIDTGSIETLGSTKIIADEEHLKHSMRDFSEAAGGTGNGTIEDMKAGGNGSAPNGIPVVGGPVVEVDGKPIKVCKYFGQDKCRLDYWRSYDRTTRELIRAYGSYYVHSSK